MRHCKTAREVVEVLGGIQAVRDLTGANVKAIYYWVGRAGMFPSREYKIMTDALRRKDARAPAWMWTMNGHKPPRESRSNAA